MSRQLAREFKYGWWGDIVCPGCQSNLSFMGLSILKVACIAAILCSPWTACSQHYYVVIGAFAADENASEFRGYLPGQFRDTVAETENMLHLYVLKTSDKETAISKTLQLKREIESLEPKGSAVVGDRVEGTIRGNLPMESSVFSQEVIAERPSASASGPAEGSVVPAGMVPPKPVGKYFKFHIESPEGKPIPGKVHHVDFESGRELAAYNANTFVDLLRPGQKSEPMAVVCGLFGYKEIHKYIDYADPSLTDEQAYVDAQGTWVIPYKLERLEKGDVSVMYNVSFYKDAAIMRKPSQTDLDELVKMMHSNPYYEVKIHSHCNGKNKRGIIAPGPDKNYFDVAGATTLTGSAKDLTALRAEAIRSYLADQGVDPGRVKVFAWGGSDMLVRSTSPDAAFNDRIEIEITRD
jgi:outer membrane protein OmpA-like peptidoglycan-associated protein